MTDQRGLPLGYTVVPANEKEYEPLAELLRHPSRGRDRRQGFWGREYKQRLAAAGTTLLTPDKTRTAANQGRARALASTRLVIESVFSNLKEQMRPSDTSPAPQPDSPCGSPQRILALRSACCSTLSTDDQHAPSPPTTAA